MDALPEISNGQRQSDSASREVRDLLITLWRRRFPAIIALQLGLLLAAVLLSSRPVEYRSGATLLLRPRSLNVDASRSVGPLDYNGGNIETEMRLINSSVIGERVGPIGWTARVFLFNPPQTDLIRVSATSLSAANARDVANAFASEYVQYRKEQVLAEFRSATDQLEKQISQHRSDIADLDRRIAALGDSNTARSELSIRDALLENMRLESARLSSLNLDSAMVTGGARVVEPAGLSQKPSSRSRLQSVLIAMAAGILMTLLVVVAFEVFDDRIQGAKDVERNFGLPVLGLIPRVPSWRRSTVPQLFFQNPRGAFAGEAFRQLRAAIDNASTSTGNVIHVTSPTSKVGKTTTIVNLATLLGWSGKSATVIDLDLRSPKVFEALNLPKGPGFCDVVANKARLSDVSVNTGLGALRAIHSGALTADPSEILSSEQTGHIIREVAKTSSVVLIDGGAIAPFADALSIVSSADITLLVVRANRTRLRQVETSMVAVARAGGKISGVVITGATDLPRWTRLSDRNLRSTLLFDRAVRPNRIAESLLAGTSRQKTRI